MKIHLAMKRYSFFKKKLKIIHGQTIQRVENNQNNSVNKFIHLPIISKVFFFFSHNWKDFKKNTHFLKNTLSEDYC